MKQLATALLLLCATLATPSQAAFHGREIARRPDMANVDMTDTVSWYSEESVRLAVEPWRAGRRVEIPQGATAAWVVCDEGGTNWIVRYDSAPSATNCVFSLAAGEGALPAGHDYAGYVSLLSGTNILGVIDHHNIVVLGQASDGGGEISPEGGAWGSVLQRLAEAEHDIQGIAGDLADHTSATNPHGITAAGIGALTNETDSAALGALNIASNALHGEITAHTSATNPHGITAEGLGALTNETDAVALAAVDAATDALSVQIAGRLPLTGGVIGGDLVVTNTTGTAGGRFAHGKNVSVGVYATAEGEGATASGMYAYASGKIVTASGYGARVVGANSKATQSWSSAAGLNAEAIHERSYVWSADSVHTYRSNGNGTWSINPNDGPNGVYIGQSNLTQIIESAVAVWMDAHGY